MTAAPSRRVASRTLRAVVATAVVLVTAAGGLASEVVGAGRATAAPASGDNCDYATTAQLSSGRLGDAQHPVAMDYTSVLRVKAYVSDENETVWASYPVPPSGVSVDVNTVASAQSTTVQATSNNAYGFQSDYAEFDIVVRSSDPTYQLQLGISAVDSSTAAACIGLYGQNTLQFVAPTPGANAGIVQASIHELPGDGSTATRVSVRSQRNDTTGAPAAASGDPVDLMTNAVLLAPPPGSAVLRPRDSRDFPVVQVLANGSATTTTLATTDATGTAIYSVTQKRSDGHTLSTPDDDQDIYKFSAYDETTHEVIGPRHSTGQRGNDFAYAINGDDIVGFGAPPAAEDTNTSITVGGNTQSNGGTPIPSATAPADGVSNVTVTVTVHASNIGDDDEILQSADVRLSSTGSAIVTPLPHNPFTDHDVFTYSVVDNVPENVTLTPFDNSHNVTVVQTAALTFSPVEADAELSSYDVSPQPSTTGGPVTASGDGLSTVTVTEHVRDSAGHAAAGHSVTLFAASGTAQVNPANVTTDSGGNAVFNVSSTTAPQTVQLRAQDSTEGSLVLRAPTIDFVPGAASTQRSTATLVGGTSATTARALPAGQASGASVQVHLVDAGGNVIAGRTVSLSQHSGRSVISGNGGTTDQYGNLSLPVSDAFAETVTYDVNVPGDSVTLQTRPQVTFTAGPPSPATSTLSAAPAAGDVGGPNTTLTAVLRDANGIAIPGASVIIGAVAQGSGGVPGCGSGTAAFVSATAASGTAATPCATATTDTAGSATFTGSDTAPENVDAVLGQPDSSGTVFAGGAYGSPITLSFAGPVSPAGSTVTTSATSIPANGSTATVTVQLVDSAGRPVVGRIVTLNAGSASPSINPASTGSNVTDATGTATLLISDRTSEVARISAVDATPADKLNGVSPTVGKSVTITFTGPPSAAQSTLSVSTTSGSADGTTPVIVTATVHDRLNHPVPGEPITLSLSQSSAVFATQTDASGTTTLSPAQAGPLTLTTNAAGSVSATVTDTAAEVVGVAGFDATFGAFTATPSITFTAPSGEAASSTVSASPSSVPADGSTASTVTVVLKTAQRVVPNHFLTLTSGSASGPVAGTQTTDANGQAVFSVASSRPSSVRYYVNDTTADPAVTLNATAVVTFTGQPTEASYSSVSVNPSTTTAGNVATVTVTLVDGVGNALAGHNVSLSADRGPNAANPGAGTTDGSGTVQIPVSDSTNETDTYTATDLTTGVVIGQTAQVVWTAPTPEATSSTVMLSQPSAPADGTSTTQLTVTLLGTGNAPLVNDRVQLRPSSGKLLVTTVTNPTDQRGRAVFNLADTVAEKVTVTIYDQTTGVVLASQAAPTFTPPSTTPVATSLTPAVGPAAGGTRVSISGSNLTGITGVTFGSVPATDVMANSSSTVTATSPAGAGTVEVTLSDGSGTSYDAGSFTYQGTVTAPTSAPPTGSTGPTSGASPSPTVTPTLSPSPTSSSAGAAPTPTPASTGPTTAVIGSGASRRAVTVRTPPVLTLRDATLVQSREAYHAGTVRVFVLANSRSSNDVAVAEALAHRVHGDLLLTDSTGVDRVVVTEIRRAAARNSALDVVGSTGEVTPRGITLLSNGLVRTVRRFGGSGPTGTSAAVLAGNRGARVVVADAGNAVTTAIAGAYAARRGDLLVLTSHGQPTAGVRTLLKRVTVDAVFGAAGRARLRAQHTITDVAAPDFLLAQSPAPNSVVVTDARAGSVLQALFTAPVPGTAILVGPTLSAASVARLGGFGRVTTVSVLGASAATVAATLAGLGAA